MLSKGPAKKVTIFINEDTQHHMAGLHDAIMTFLMHKERLRRHRYPRLLGLRLPPDRPLDAD